MAVENMTFSGVYMIIFKVLGNARRHFFQSLKYLLVETKTKEKTGK